MQLLTIFLVRTVLEALLITVFVSSNTSLSLEMGFFSSREVGFLSLSLEESVTLDVLETSLVRKVGRRVVIFSLRSCMESCSLQSIFLFFRLLLKKWSDVTECLLGWMWYLVIWLLVVAFMRVRNEDCLGGLWMSGWVSLPVIRVALKSVRKVQYPPRDIPNIITPGNLYHIPISSPSSSVIIDKDTIVSSMENSNFAGSSPKDYSYLDQGQILNEITAEDRESITCPICMGIVINPIECSSCETIFCESEVSCKQSPQGLKRHCPVCKNTEWKEYHKIHKSYRSKLQSLMLSCHTHEECKEQKFTYNKYLDHIVSKTPQKSSDSSSPSFFEFYYKDGDSWKEYPLHNNLVANLHLRRGETEFIIMGYRVDINKMVQLNLKSHFSRKIKMECDRNRVQQPIWTSETDSNKQEPYDSETNRVIEKAHQEFLLGRCKGADVKVGKYEYEVDLVKMVQRNKGTRKERAVTRIML